MLTITAYQTTIKPFFYNYDIELQLWYLLLFIPFLLTGIMLFEHKYTQPSLYHYTWDMGYEHGTKLRGAIEKIDTRLKKIEDKLNELHKT